MSSAQLVLLAVVILVWWAIHSGLLKWMVVAWIFGWVFG